MYKTVIWENGKLIGRVLDGSTDRQAIFYFKWSAKRAVKGVYENLDVHVDWDLKIKKVGESE